MLILRCQTRELGLLARRDKQTLAQSRERADADVFRDRPIGKDSVRLAVARNQRHRRAHCDSRLVATRRAEDGEEQVGLTVPGQPGETDDLPFVGDQLHAVVLPRRARADAPGAVFLMRPSLLDDGLRASRHGTHHRDQRVAIEGADGIDGGDLAIAHHHDSIGVLQYFAEQMRNQDAALAARDEVANERQQLACRVGVQGRGRFIEDDQRERVLGDGEGACHFHHLAPADRKVPNDGRCGDVVPGKDLVELCGNQRGRPAPPGHAAQRRVVDARVLCDAQVRAERELLEHAPDAELQGLRHRIVFLEGAADGDAPAVGRESAREHLHEGRLARPVVADQADALAGRDGEVDALEGADGTEMLLGAFQLDDHYLMFVLIAAIASAWLYSLVATLPAGILGKALSKSPCVKAR